MSDRGAVDSPPPQQDALIKEFVGDDGETYVIMQKGAVERRRIFSPIFILLLFSVLASTATAVGVGLITNDTNDAARNTEALIEQMQRDNSPEAVEARNALLEGIIVRVDCNDASRLQRVIDGLVAQGVLDTGIDVTENCGDDMGTGAGTQNSGEGTDNDAGRGD